jgi:sugar/nucleoside kinase (ribokinase family)
MRGACSGSSLNDAVNARREGAIVSIVAPVGDDPNGNQFFFQCEANGINSQYIRTMKGLTPKIEVIENASGEKIYQSWEYGVAPSYHFRKKEYSWFRKQDAVVLVAYAPTLHLLDELAAERRTRRNNSPEEKTMYVVDFDDLIQFGKDIHNIEQYLDVFDVFLFSLDKENDVSIVGDIEKLSKESQKLFIVTLGARGTEVRKGDEAYGYYGPATPALNAAEARNFDLAAFLVSYLKTHDILESLEMGGLSILKTV